MILRMFQGTTRVEGFEPGGRHLVPPIHDLSLSYYSTIYTLQCRMPWATASYG
jgi:hypothetical protein